MLPLASVAALALAATPPLAPEVSVGAVAWEYRGFLAGSVPFLGVEASYRHPLSSLPLLLGGMVRSPGPVAGAGVPVEAALSLELRAPLAAWHPSVAFELGWSGLAQIDLSWRGGLPPAVHAEEEARVGPWYGGVTLSPLRLVFQRWTLSAFELHLGATAFPVGAGARLQLSLLRVGALL